MNFKTVHGLGRSDYAKKAFEAAMSNFANPSFVDAWLTWFDAQPGDQSALDAAILGDIERRSQCDQCAVTVACPDECSQEDVKPAGINYVGGKCERVIRVCGKGGPDGAHTFCITPCDGCEYNLTILPSDCPQPEYYLGDLEEVAHAASRAAIELAIGVVRAAHPIYLSTVGDIVKILGGALDQIQAEISRPGYVEELLPA